MNEQQPTRFRSLVKVARASYDRFFVIQDAADEFTVECDRQRVFVGNFEATLKWLECQRRGSPRHETQRRYAQ